MKIVTVAREKIETDAVAEARDRCDRDDWARTSDAALGFPPALHHHFLDLYYTEDQLGYEPPGMVTQDRRHSRDVIRYRWRANGDLALAEHPYTTVPAPAHVHVPPRDYQRVHFLNDPQTVQWLATLLALIPLPDRKPEGHIAINTARTFGEVVAFPHLDQGPFSFIYVVDRQCEGGVTSLYDGDVLEGSPPKLVPGVTPMTAATLNPGEVLAFRRIVHDVTPLQPRWKGDEPNRSTVLIIMDEPGLYTDYPIPADD
jgi:hypothetical protein